MKFHLLVNTLSQALNGEYALAIRAFSRIHTGENGFSLNQDCARTAFGLIAAYFGAG
jgi:hypothetical protein